MFYFSLGAILRDRMEKYAVPSLIIGTLALIWGIMYCGFTYLFYDNVSGIEYYFGSIVCVLYAIVVFVFLASRHIENSRIVSSLFLPVYALHWEVKMLLLPIDTSCFYSYSPLIQFTMLSVATILLSWILMKIPYLNKCFKI